MVYSILLFFEANKKPLFWVFKFFIIALLGVLILEKILTYESTSDIVRNVGLKLEIKRNWPYLVLCLLLMFCNWGLETTKWQYLTNSFTKLNFFKASESILLGITIGIVTPSRVGEYGGRVINLPSRERPNGLKAHFLSSMSQNIVNIIGGIIGAYYYLNNYSDISGTMISAICTIAFIFSILLVSVYYGNNTIIDYVKSMIPLKLLGKININSESLVEHNILNIALLISLLRYLIFVSQYILLLYFFGLAIPLEAMISGVALIYLIQSGVPLPPFLSMLARGEIAIVIWSFFSVSILSILSATFTLWILNLLLPALVGAVILLRKT